MDPLKVTKVSQLVRGVRRGAACIVPVDLWSICDAPVLVACRPYTENVFVGIKQKTILIRRRVTLLNISTVKMRVDLTVIRYVVRINLLYIAYTQPVLVRYRHRAFDLMYFNLKVE